MSGDGAIKFPFFLHLQNGSDILSHCAIAVDWKNKAQSCVFSQSFCLVQIFFLKAKKMLLKASRDIHLIHVKSFEVEKLCAITEH